MTIFSATQIKFDKNYLEELIGDPQSGVSRQQCEHHIALHPAQFNDFGQSIKDELGKKIGKYDDSFKGIMLGFTDIKLNSQLGTIGIDNCYVHMDLQASFFVFKPELGMILKGKVTRTTKDHVGCLVYNTFNISLPKPEGVEEGWLGTKAAMGNDVEFEISYVDLNARLPHIRGELRSILTKSNEEDELESGPSMPKIEGKKHGKKRISFPEEVEVGIEEIPSTETPKKSKKKKHRERQVSETNETTEPKKKHKKSRKHKEKLPKPKNDDSDISLESLDLKSLFDTPMDFDPTQPPSQTADITEKKFRRKRSHSISQELYLKDVKLEADSDLEKMIK